MSIIHGQELAGLSGIQLVDVRTKVEHLMGHIPQSVNIPLDELAQRVGELDLSQPIVVYCAVGMRSEVAMHLLTELGAVDVRNLVGGYKMWRSSTPR